MSNLHAKLHPDRLILLSKQFGIFKILYFPPFSIALLQILIGFGVIGEDSFFAVPFQPLAREAHSDYTENAQLRKLGSVGERRTGFSGTFAGSNPLGMMPRTYGDFLWLT